MTTTARGGGNLLPIAIYLRGLREQMGITQEKLAGVMGITPRHLARWEAGETQIGSGPLLKAILELPVSIAHLSQLMRKDATVEVARRLAEERLQFIHARARLIEQIQQEKMEELMMLMAAASPDEIAELQVLLRERAAKRSDQ